MNDIKFLHGLVRQQTVPMHVQQYGYRYGDRDQSPIHSQSHIQALRTLQIELTPKHVWNVQINVLLTEFSDYAAQSLYIHVIAGPADYEYIAACYPMEQVQYLCGTARCYSSTNCETYLRIHASLRLPNKLLYIH